MRVTADKIGDIRIDMMDIVGQFAVPVNRSALDEQGREAVEKLIGDDLLCGLSPPPHAAQDSDGDWQIIWESNSGAKFRLDLQKNALAATFESVEDHRQSLDVMTLHATTGFNMLGVRAVTGLLVRMRNRFVLPEGTSNKALAIERILSSAEQSPFENLGQRKDAIGRFDLKFSLRHKDKYDAFFTVELPANRDHRTVWTETALRTRADTRTEVSNEEVAELIDSAYEVYCTSYAGYLEKLLGKKDVTYLD